MRVLIQADMEGIANVAHVHETNPWHREYWDVGRSRMTADVAAAVRGLLEGGATEVVVYDGHGSGRPNLSAGDLPEAAGVIEIDRDPFQNLQYDFTFQVGRHARCGTNTGFMPHTQSPRL